MPVSACAACGGPLDTTGQTTGMDARCLELYGLTRRPDVHEAQGILALLARAVDPSREDVGAAVSRLFALRQPRLAAAVAVRFGLLLVERRGDELCLDSRTLPSHALEGMDAVRVDDARRCWCVPANDGQSLMAALHQTIPGQWGIGPRGVFRC